MDLSESFLAAYEPIGTLGEGGMAHVILARQRSLDREVAVKFMAGAAFPAHEANERFLREAKMLARLDHPNVLKIYDMGVESDQPYLVLEYVKGESVRERLTKNGRIMNDEAAHIALMVARGLAYAHDKDILHRDVKPENVLLSKEGGVKLLDFGLGKLLELSQNISHGGVILGTPAYLAPELILGNPPSECSDLYTVGVLLFEMLTGHTPFGDSAEADRLLERTKNEAPLGPLEAAGVEKRLLEVLAKALRRDPEERWHHAYELVEALELWSGVSADPRIRRSAPGMIRPTRKDTSGRHRRTPSRSGRLVGALRKLPVRPLIALCAFLVAIATGAAVWLLRPLRAPSDPGALEVLSGVAGGRVRWRSTDAYVGSVTARGPAGKDNQPGSEVTLRESAATTNHDVTLSNLTRGASYDLAVGDDSGPLFPRVPLQTAPDVELPHNPSLEPESSERAIVRLEFNVPVTVVARSTATELTVTGGDNPQIAHRLVISGPGAGVGMFKLDLTVSTVEGTTRQETLDLRGGYEHLAEYVHSPGFKRDLTAIDNAWLTASDPQDSLAAVRRKLSDCAALRNRTREIEWLAHALGDSGTALDRRIRLYELLSDLERFNRIPIARAAHDGKTLELTSPLLPISNALEVFAESTAEEKPLGPAESPLRGLFTPPTTQHPALKAEDQDLSGAQILLSKLATDPQAAPTSVPFEAFLDELPRDGRIKLAVKGRCLSAARFLDLNVNGIHRLRFFGAGAGVVNDSLHTAAKLAQGIEFEKSIPARVLALTVPGGLLQPGKNTFSVTATMVAPSMSQIDGACITVLHWVAWMPTR